MSKIPALTNTEWFIIILVVIGNLSIAFSYKGMAILLFLAAIIIGVKTLLKRKGQEG